MFKKHYVFPRNLVDERWYRALFNLVIDLQVIKQLKPINSGQQKQLFMEGKIANPLFKYKGLIGIGVIEKLKKIEKEITENEKNHIIKKLYLRKIEYLKNQYEFIKLIGTDKREFLEASKKLYGDVNQKDFKKIIKKFDLEQLNQNEGKIHSGKIKTVFEKHLKDHKLDSWKVFVNKRRHNVAVNVNYFTKSGKPYQRIFIPGHYKISKSRLYQLVRHEIETHILRQVNAKMQKYGILRRPFGTANEFIVEEGLATYNAKIISKNKAMGSEVLGLIALGLVSKGLSFRELYEKLLSLGFNSDLAWARTLRVFRGVKDTGKRGIYCTTDNVYFSGYKLIKKEFAKNSNIYKKLYIGKIGLEDLDLIDKLDINYDIIIPKFYK